MLNVFSGARVNPLELSIHDVFITDIAHSLALVNRFGGHSRVPISVAQHSVLVSLLCEDTPDDLAGLLHDASEAYLGDVIKWLKLAPEMEAFRRAEDQAQAVIFERFGVSAGSTVDWADKMAVRYEFEVAFGFGQVDPGYGLLTKGEYHIITRLAKQWPSLWRPVMTWQEAEAAFLQRFRDLTVRAGRPTECVWPNTT